MVKSGSAALFDVGLLDNISARDILRIKWVFVTHTHVDHFIGFDRIIRTNIPHFRTVQVVGPRGIADNISGKLRGYLWNLLETDQIKYEVLEIGPAEVLKYLICSTNKYVPVLVDRFSSNSFKIALDDGSHVEPLILDHGTDCLAFLLMTPERWRFDREKMVSMGLHEGPWIKDLQQSAHEVSEADHKEMVIQGHSFSLSDLRQRLLESIPSQRVGYITDVGFSKNNLEKLILNFQSLDALWCESCFSDNDRIRATKTKHLTTKQSAFIARLLKAKEFHPFHISGIYGATFPEIHAEALGNYHAALSLTDEELQKQVDKELEVAGLSN